jgi:hypothetical protein
MSDFGKQLTYFSVGDVESYVLSSRALSFVFLDTFTDSCMAKKRRRCQVCTGIVNEDPDSAEEEARAG